MLLLVAIAAGCSTSPTLELDVAADSAPGKIVLTKRPVVLHVARYVAAGPLGASSKVGEASVAVADMLGRELHVLDVSATVTTAMAKQLGASGFDIVVDGADADRTDFELSGVIREFSLNIAARDEVSVVVETTLRDRRNNTLWSGVVTEKADRFAGVAGNTRSSITRYLGTALARVSAKTRDAVAESIVQTHPELFQPAVFARAAVPGVTVLVEPAQQAPASRAAAEGTTGRVAIATTPARVKVYVGDVYYGLSPLAFELQPGVHTLQFKLDGFQTATEKVSVRKHETTELEIRLAR